MNDDLDIKKFNVGFDSADPKVMYLTIPLETYAKDREDGMALFYGKMREAEAHGARMIKEKRMRADQGGILKAAPAALHLDPKARPN